VAPTPTDDVETDSELFEAEWNFGGMAVQWAVGEGGEAAGAVATAAGTAVGGG